jgi:probable rRNA maturation factor
MGGDGSSRAAFRVGVVDGRGRPRRAAGLARWLADVAPRGARGGVTVALVSDARMRALNRTYRGRDYPTDVLSFPSAPGSRLQAPGRAPRTAPARTAHHAPVRTPGDQSLGDIVIAIGVAMRQARKAGHPLATELRVLALHGLLHLLGHDHERDGGTMRRVEARLRRAGGLESGLIERETRR